MYVADGNRSPSMRARTPTKLDSFARGRAPHHGPQSPHRFSFSEHEKRRAPSYPSYEAVCAFSARARPFSLRLASPRGALPARGQARFRVRGLVRGLGRKESRLFRGHFRIREGHDQTRGKNSRKTYLDDSSWKFFSVRDFDFRYETILSAKDVLNVGVRRETF